MHYSRLKQMIKAHEGAVKNKDGRHVVYDDATGKPIRPGQKIEGVPTIGWGQNLAFRGISEEIADLILGEEIRAVYQALTARFPSYRHLDSVRQDALVDMAFNTGLAGISGFRDMWTCLEQAVKAQREGRPDEAAAAFERAAGEMLNSQWAKQVGRRAEELAAMVRTGEYAQDLVIRRKEQSHEVSTRERETGRTVSP